MGTRVEVATAYGPARADVDLPAGRAPVALLVLGHGAGGTVDAADLAAVRDHALAAGVAVARVTQPYRVAGRRAPAPAAQLDAAWLTVVAALRDRWPEPALLVGGRSSGARVACRTAVAAGAAGIVALAFPVRPPGRPDRSRADELATGLPTLAVAGGRDPFGVPPRLPAVEVALLPAERHDLSRDPQASGALVVDWLRRRGWAAGQNEAGGRGGAAGEGGAGGRNEAGGRGGATGEGEAGGRGGGRARRRSATD